MDSLQGIPVEYKLDTFNMPHTGTTLCHPKIGYVDPTRNPTLDTLALSSPLGHFNGDHAHLSTRRTKTMVTLKHNPSHVRRHILPSQYSQLLITPFRLNTHNLSRVLQHQKQTQYSMLQIKPIHKNIFRPSASYLLHLILPLIPNNN